MVGSQTTRLRARLPVFRCILTNACTTVDSPYCENFLSKTLWPAFQDLGTTVMDLTVIPFGNAHVDEESKTVKCQHGGGKFLFSFIAHANELSYLSMG